MQDDPRLNLNISLRRTSLILLFVSFSVVALSGVARIGAILLAVEDSRLIRVLYANSDDSIPSWYSAVLLLMCAVALSLVAYEKWISNADWRWNWIFLALVFAYLSMDEAISIHELFTPLGREILSWAGTGAGGSISRAWVVPGLLAVIAVLLLNARFLSNLPGRTKRLFGLAVLVFFGGAVGMEVATDLYTYSLGGVQNLSIIENLGRTLVLTHIEEFIEMVGAVIFLHASLDYARSTVPSFRIDLAP